MSCQLYVMSCNALALSYRSQVKDCHVIVLSGRDSSCHVMSRVMRCSSHVVSCEAMTFLSCNRMRVSCLTKCHVLVLCCSVMSSDVNSSHVMSCQIMSYYCHVAFLSGFILSFHVVFWHVMSCQHIAMTGKIQNLSQNAQLCHVKLRHRQARTRLQSQTCPRGCSQRANRLT